MTAPHRFKLLLAWFLLVLVGGESSSKDGETGKVQTEIISDPPGARIEVNGNYIGDTPLATTFRQRWGKIVGQVVIRASPSEPNLATQEKRLIGPVVPLTGGADEVPSRLLFDLRRGQAFVGQHAPPFPSTAQAFPDTARRSKSSGTAFAVTDDGYFLTAYHVVANAAQLELRKGQTTWPVELIRKDLKNDLALLKSPGIFHALPIVESTGVKLGDAVFTIGYPNPQLQGVEPKLTDGRISSLMGLHDDAAQFQVSVPVHPGNSGGPLINDQGQVVGIIVQRLNDLAGLASSGFLPQTINYAAKSSFVKIMLNDVSEVAERLKHVESSPDLKFEDAVKGAERATFLLLVY